MSEPAGPPAPGTGRPATVVGAFACWIVAAVLIAALGLLVLTGPAGLAQKVIGILLLLVGLALAFLADRARKGDIRFARAALGLAMASVAFLALLLLIAKVAGIVLAIAVIIALLILGAVLNQRRTSQSWYEQHEAGAA